MLLVSERPRASQPVLERVDIIHSTKKPDHYPDHLIAQIRAVTIFAAEYTLLVRDLRVLSKSRSSTVFES